MLLLHAAGGEQAGGCSPRPQKTFGCGGQCHEPGGDLTQIVAQPDCHRLFLAQRVARRGDAWRIAQIIGHGDQRFIDAKLEIFEHVQAERGLEQLIAGGPLAEGGEIAASTQRHILPARGRVALARQRLPQPRALAQRLVVMFAQPRIQFRKLCGEPPGLPLQQPERLRLHRVRVL
jgi:hypothetical protein